MYILTLIKLTQAVMPQWSMTHHPEWICRVYLHILVVKIERIYGELIELFYCANKQFCFHVDRNWAALV